MPQHEYEDHEVQEILNRAISIDAVANDRQEMLKRTAAELGVSPEAVEQAESEFLRDRVQQEEQREFRKSFRRVFWDHLVSYLVVNAFLIGICLVSSRGKFWAIYPILGWGIGLAFHAFATFFPSQEEYDKEFKKWRKKRNKARSTAIL